ncbi:MAG: adenosylmethionine--8-amino-7-oxononanoate transaminase [Polyangiaceae bacterium]|nr:adenosylmethionine--8-amino-7-oxononanoate transaminase [Polyangiaceae bacterium]
MSQLDTKSQRSETIRRDKKFVWHPYTEMSSYIESTEPLVIDRAAGSRLFEKDGRVIIDGNSSWWTALLGHQHPRLVKALTDQAQRLCHTSLGGVTHEPAVDFAEEVLRVAPPGVSRVFFSDNGSTAVEAALKMAVQFHQQRPVSQFRPQSPGSRTHFISLEDAFHGETMGVTALGGVEAFRRPFGSMTMPVTHLPSPADDLDRSLSALEQVLSEREGEIAGLVVEPLIQGAGGMKIYDPEFLNRARELTERSGVLLIVDEVFTGYGRTGSFWALNQTAIQADIVASAKGMSGGMLPFAATLTSEEVYRAFLGDRSRTFMYGHTYCGNPLGAAVAAEVLRVYRDEEILAGVQARAKMIAETFQQLAALPGVENSRSLGMCGALELNPGESPSRKGYLANAGWEVYRLALERGVYIRPLGNVVYTVPPLNIPEEDLELLLRVLAESVMEVVGFHGE